MSNNSRCFAVVNRTKLRHNCDVMRGFAGQKNLMAVVKADGYGHGATEVARTICDKVQLFGVATVQEGFRLREAGITKPIVVLGYISSEHIVEAAQRDICATMYDYDYARRHSERLAQHGLSIKYHLKVDTGMNRLGFKHDDRQGMQKLFALPSLIPEGIFTHFAVADCENSDDTEFTHTQQQLFVNLVRDFAVKGQNFTYIHSENTAGTAFGRFDVCNTARCGIGLLGYPPGNIDIDGLQPVLSLHATVAQVHTLTAGEAVSYGRTYRATTERTVATITVGYADGYPRHLSGCGIVSVGGEPAPVIGNVCMDQLVVDVTDINKPNIGDKVVLMGIYPAMDAMEIARRSGTIVYEILCNISPRVERIYTD